LEVFTRKGVDDKTAQKLVDNGYTFTKVARATDKVKRELEKMLGEKKLKQLIDAVKTKERMPRKKKEKPLKRPVFSKKTVLPVKTRPATPLECQAQQDAGEEGDEPLPVVSEIASRLDGVSPDKISTRY
jgi:hypothetical protein